MSDPFPFPIAAHLTAHKEQVRADLALYYALYTGKWFEEIASWGDPDRFSPADVAAVAVLAAELNARAVAAVLIDSADALNKLLAECPDRSTDIRDVGPEVLAPGAPLARLLTMLESLPGMDKVQASKLLAAKRPSLVPIRDPMVEVLLGTGPAWWEPTRLVMLDPVVVEELTVASAGIAPPHVPLLRVLEIFLWMEGRRQRTT